MARSVAIIGTRGFPSYYGGFETAVRELAPYLAANGWDVTVYGRRKAVRHDDPLAESNVRSVLTPGLDFKALSTLSYGATASAHALTKKPDVALVMNVANGFFLPMLKARGIPTLVNVDGIEWDRDKWGSTAKKMFVKGAQLTAQYADNLVFDAEAIGDRWRRDFGRDGVYIPYGGRFREDLPIEPGLEHRGYVLVVARFVPENTIAEFLTAAERIAKKWPVVIVGSTGYGGELDDRADKLARENEDVHWLGHVSDDDRLHSLWQHAGVYFHGHSVGGTNPALVQAMALGAPVVARDTIYNREVLKGAGALTPPTPDDIAAKVEDIMSSPSAQSSFAATSSERAASVFTWPLVSGAYERALADLASPNPLITGTASASTPSGAR